MYIELIAVDDRYARSLVCAEEMNCGGFAKVKGLAAMTKFGVDVSGETYEVEALTDDKGELFVLYAPEHHEYDERVLPGSVPNVPANVPARGYILHKGMEVRVEVGNIEGTVAVGDKVVVGAGTFKLTKATAAGTETNVLGKVVEVGKRYGVDMVSILFA